MKLPARDWLERMTDRFGRRGACLILFGVAWVIVGIGIEVDPPPREPGVLIIHELLPHWLRASLWAATGAAAAWVGARARLDRDDTWGFVAIVAMPIERFISFLVSWLIYATTDLLAHWFPAVEVTGYNRGWYSAVVWLIVVLALLVISGWRNPSPPMSRDHDDARG